MRAACAVLPQSWRVSQETAWSFLQRIVVAHHPHDHLRALVRLTYEVLVEGDPGLIINELRGWLDDKLHRTLTAPMVWGHLEAKGFTRKLLAGDPTATRVLADTAHRHRRLIDGRLPAAGAVPQPLVGSMVEKLASEGAPQVLVLHGRAGSGKSTVAADAERELTAAGWFSGVVSMDKATADEHTAATLGRRIGLPGSDPQSCILLESSRVRFQHPLVRSAIYEGIRRGVCVKFSGWRRQCCEELGHRADGAALELGLPPGVVVHESGVGSCADLLCVGERAADDFECGGHSWIRELRSRCECCCSCDRPSGPTLDEPDDVVGVFRFVPGRGSHQRLRLRDQERERPRYPECDSRLSFTLR